MSNYVIKITFGAMIEETNNQFQT